MTDKILLVGATGLIGNIVTRKLLAQNGGKNLHLLARRPYRADIGEGKVHVALQENWPATIAKIKPKIAISCLGSTIKKAGSQEEFAAVDRDLVGAVAQASKSAGARQFIAISSAMANAAATNFYLKIKGEAEDIMRAQHFDRLDIIRPGLLRGDRQNDWRPAERLAIIASPVIDMLLHGNLRRYRSIHAEDVASALINLLAAEVEGAYIHENDQILALK